MQIAVRADDNQKQAFLSKGIPESVSVHWMENTAAIPNADAYFDLQFEDAGETVFALVTDKPVFLNTVITISKELPQNAVRINAWNGFLENSLIEIAGNDTAVSKAEDILRQLNWSYEIVPDIPGMIIARIIAMIINEAYFGLGDEISTKNEIDIAMKLGTNYPYGPFEWSEKIGLKNIYALLKKLSLTDTRYTPSPTLVEEYQTLTNNQ